MLINSPNLSLVEKCRKIIKEKIKSEKCLEHFSQEYTQLVNILKRSISNGESDSVLIIGQNGCGKTAFLNEALDEVKRSCSIEEFIIINLNGLIHIDDSLALKEIIEQLKLADTTEELTGSFSENLQYLLKSLRDSENKISKSLIFILEEFHQFCSHRNQTLLYNLFDCVQSTNGICVVGVTTRLDVTEMLEKRVKSRFSDRQIFLLHHPTGKQRISLFKKLLSLPEYMSSFNIDRKFIQRWNQQIEKLSNNDNVIKVLNRQLVIDVNEEKFRLFLLALVCQMTEEHNLLTSEDVTNVERDLSKDDKVSLLQGLSVLEICLVISMKHQHEIFDGEPFNFEMIVNRYLKFATQNYAVQITQRPVILKAFERLKYLEIISPVGVTGRNVQKEFQLYNFRLTKDQVMSAVNNYNGIPTDVAQWSTSSLL